MELTISNKLRRELQRNVAEMQDEVVGIVYSVLDDAVMHSGTAIWRCYGGKRFSEDIDMYCRYGADFKDCLYAATER